MCIRDSIIPACLGFTKGYPFARSPLKLGFVRCERVLLDEKLVALSNDAIALTENSFLLSLNLGSLALQAFPLAKQKIPLRCELIALFMPIRSLRQRVLQPLLRDIQRLLERPCIGLT